MKKKTKKKLDFNMVIIAAACILGIWMVVKGFVIQPVINSNKEQAKELQKQISEEQQRVEEVKGLIEKSGTDEYIERIAREKLGMIKSDEIVFIDVSGQK